MGYVVHMHVIVAFPSLSEVIIKKIIQDPVWSPSALKTSSGPWMWRDWKGREGILICPWGASLFERGRDRHKEEMV